METEKGTNPEDDGEFLAFEVGGQGYAVDIAAVREIRGWTEPAGMPNAACHVMGVINLRGEILPLLDLAAKLGLHTAEINERSVIIVFEFQGATMGVLIDAVSDIIAPSEKDMQPPPDAAASENGSFVSALTMVDDKIIRILDLATLLSDIEPKMAQVS